MAENSDTTLPFVCKNLYDDGQPLSETARLSSSLQLYVNCTCASLVSEKVVGPKPYQPNRLPRPCCVPRTSTGNLANALAKYHQALLLP